MILRVAGVEKLTQAKRIPEAQALLRKDHYDIILIDEFFPNAEVMALVKQARTRTGLRAPAVVMVTGPDFNDRRKPELTQSGVQGFIGKPVDGERLLSMLDAIFQQRREAQVAARDNSLAAQKVEVSRKSNNILDPEASAKQLAKKFTARSPKKPETAAPVATPTVEAPEAPVETAAPPPTTRKAAPPPKAAPREHSEHPDKMYRKRPRELEAEAAQRARPARVLPLKGKTDASDTPAPAAPPAPQAPAAPPPMAAPPQYAPPQYAPPPPPQYAPPPLPPQQPMAYAPPPSQDQLLSQLGGAYAPPPPMPPAPPQVLPQMAPPPQNQNDLLAQLGLAPPGMPPQAAAPQPSAPPPPAANAPQTQQDLMSQLMNMMQANAAAAPAPTPAAAPAPTPAPAPAAAPIPAAAPPAPTPAAADGGFSQEDLMQQLAAMLGGAPVAANPAPAKAPAAEQEPAPQTGQSLLDQLARKR
ncbi:hypothetical protein JCM17960_02420 [Magnetospira thiophila]